MDNNVSGSRQSIIPAIGETDLDEAASITGNDTTESQTSNRAKVYQDDIDYKNSDVDPVINEQTDSPADELNIPEDEYRDELNKFADDDTGTGDDDMRETIEDRDEDDDSSATGTE
jgi:hypothetical protein